MNDILKTYMERFRENRHTLRRYTAFVLALAMITTLFVNWQLHGVGISMTAQYQCGEEEHIHTADCYTKVLTCGYEEGELENADEVAAAAATSQPTVESEPAPLSLEPQIEFVPHEHTEDCYTEVQTLTCMEEEHVHDDDCFDPEDGTLAARACSPVCRTGSCRLPRWSRCRLGHPYQWRTRSLPFCSLKFCRRQMQPAVRSTAA